jgi:hypothetical protein
VFEDRIVGLDQEVLEQLVGVDVDEQRVVGAVGDRGITRVRPRIPSFPWSTASAISAGGLV